MMKSLKGKSRIAIIGWAYYNLAFIRKARQMGLSVIYLGTHPEDERYASFCERYYNIETGDLAKAVAICRREQVGGVFSQIETADVIFAARIAEELGLVCTPASTLLAITDKQWVRVRTTKIEGLATPRVWVCGDGTNDVLQYPVVVKPAHGRGKTGVTYVGSGPELATAVEYARAADETVLAEEFITGAQVTAESISFDGHHLVLQITDQVNSGAPHSVELEGHEPSHLPMNVQERIINLVPRLLDAVGYTNGPTHIEFMLSPNGQIYLIEINPRGGGSGISSTLVSLSTNVDYCQAVLAVAMGSFVWPVSIRRDVRCCGILDVCKQTEGLLEVLRHARQYWWCYRYSVRDDLSKPLKVMATTNTGAGLLTYVARRRITGAELAAEPRWQRIMRLCLGPGIRLLAHCRNRLITP